MVGFIESAMPADGIPRCHSPRTETSARPVSKSSSKETGSHAHPKDLHIGQDAAQTILSKPMAPRARPGREPGDASQGAKFDGHHDGGLLHEARQLTEGTIEALHISVADDCHRSSRGDPLNARSAT
jgi:hypothetical protein